MSDKVLKGWEALPHDTMWAIKESSDNVSPTDLDKCLPFSALDLGLYLPEIRWQFISRCHYQIHFSTYGYFLIDSAHKYIHQSVPFSDKIHIYFFTQKCE